MNTERRVGAAEPRYETLGAAHLHWNMHRFMAEAEWGPELWGFVRPFARLGAGYSLQSLELQAGEPVLEDNAHDLAGQAALGLELFLPFHLSPRAFPFSVGVSSQVGYSAQTLAEFDELEADDDDDAWTREQAALGGVEIDGLFWDIGVNLRLRF